jgi:D-galactose 1-dehydrogenase
MSMAYRVAVMGLGKIAQDQHLPAIAKSNSFDLVATVSSRSEDHGVPTFPSLDRLIDSGIEVDAMSLCMPPMARFDLARAALDAGFHLLLERPPTSTVGQLDSLLAHAAERDRVVFTAWHSRHNAAVREAARRLTGSTVRRMRITWKEDVRFWHPGQEWIWEPGGFGVFDPGINALSLIPTILPEPVIVSDAEISVPSNRSTPIAASIRFRPASGRDADMTAEFDWLQAGEPSWDIDIETTADMRLQLSKGGTELRVDGALVDTDDMGEYDDIYRRFASLLAAGESDADGRPLQLVSDCLMLGRRVEVDAFS